MYSLYLLLDTVLNLFMWFVVVWVVLSWLIHFGVVNPRNGVVFIVWDFLSRLLEPLLNPINRWVLRILPRLRGINLAPLILVLLIYFFRNLLAEYWPVSLAG